MHLIVGILVEFCPTHLHYVRLFTDKLVNQLLHTYIFAFITHFTKSTHAYSPALQPHTHFQNAIVSRSQTAFFHFYLWWRKKGSGLVYSRYSS